MVGIESPSGEGNKVPRVVQISFSDLENDPRVRRHNDALQRHGWSVAGVGLSPALPRTTVSTVSWPIVSVGTGAPTSFGARASVDLPITETFAQTGKISKVRRVLGRLISSIIGMSRTRALLEVARRLPLYEMATALKALGPADIWVANDWSALPVAVWAQEEFGGHIVYDSHEFAAAEHEELLSWWIFERPMMVALEKTFIGRARLVTSVSMGICRALQTRYRLSTLPTVIMNAPPFEPLASQTNQSLTDSSSLDHRGLLYHGVVMPGRGIELLLETLAYLPTNYTLVIRGPCSPSSYGETLNQFAITVGVSDRVTFAPAIPMRDLVKAATHHDIGFMLLPGHSRHNRFALPNKIFEYASAGLAVIVSNLPEMADFIAGAKNGLIDNGKGPQSLAQQIVAISQSELMAMKAASTAFSAHCNGETEGRRLDSLYRSLLANG